MSKTKIVLSDKELEMVNDCDWILTKQRIIQSVFSLLESVVEDIDSLILTKWEALSQHQTSPPRIFKGENYLGLPYVTLDYPKLFNSENTLTVRTMFWWGNFVSVTLHAGSNYTQRLVDKLIHALPLVGDLYICVHENQWHHYFEPDNYELVQNIPREKLEELKSRDFMKVAYKIDLAEFNKLHSILIKRYQMIAEILV